MKKIITILFILPFSTIVAQNKHYVEEIALYHLDSLTKISPVFKNFKYFTNGYLSKFRTDTGITYFMSVKPDLFIKSPFKNLEINENPKLVSFFVPKRMRKNGSSTVLNIFGYTKLNGNYIVCFSVELDEGGQKALIIMNNKGDLVSFKYSRYMY